MLNYSSEKEFLFNLDLDHMEALIANERFNSDKIKSTLNSETPLHVFDLSEKTMSILSKNNIFTVANLEKLSFLDMCRMRGMGKSSLDEIESILDIEFK